MVDLKSFTGFSFKEKGFGFKNPIVRTGFDLNPEQERI